jgi:hypothetical protein
MRRTKEPPATHSALELSTVTAPAISTPAALRPCCHDHVVTEDASNEIRFGCGVDCESGGINVAMSRDDKSAIIRLERIRIWDRNKPDQEAEDALVAGADDKIFRVDRADAEECAELVTDRPELAAIRHNK